MLPGVYVRPGHGVVVNRVFIASHRADELVVTRDHIEKSSARKPPADTGAKSALGY
jgi:hypothetical protein